MEQFQASNRVFSLLTPEGHDLGSEFCSNGCFCLAAVVVEKGGDDENVETDAYSGTLSSKQCSEYFTRDASYRTVCMSTWY